MKMLSRAHRPRSLSRLPLVFLSAARMAHGQETPEPGTAEGNARGFLGVMVSDVRPDVRAQTTLRDGEGLQVAMVAPDSPATAAGVKAHDILLRLDDQILVSQSQFVRLVENAGPGQEVELTLLHRGAEKKTRVVLSVAPPPSRHVASEGGPQVPEVSAMLGFIVDTLRENPSAVEAVYRMLSTLPASLEGAAPSMQLRFRSVTRKCEEGSEELILRDSGHYVRIFDPAGTLLFEGPVATPEQCAAVPPELRGRLEKVKAQAELLLRQPAAGGSSAPGN